jgi:hypothetical protein
MRGNLLAAETRLTIEASPPGGLDPGGVWHGRPTAVAADCRAVAAGSVKYGY